MVRSRPNQGYRYDKAGVTPAGTTPAEGDGTLPEFALPVRVRGQAIGALEAHKGSDGGDWSPDEVTLLEQLSDQLGVALESARLYQDTQHRAMEERLIGEITSRMRATLDLETVLQTAAEEIYHALGLDRVMVRLGTSPTTQSAGETDNGL
jgi:GAF domain-containing protein